MSDEIRVQTMMGSENLNMKRLARAIANQALAHLIWDKTKIHSTTVKINTPAYDAALAARYQTAWNWASACKEVRLSIEALETQLIEKWRKEAKKPRPPVPTHEEIYGSPPTPEKQ